MRYSYKLRSVIYILVGVSVAAISMWLTALPASADDTKPKTASSAAPPAVTEPSVAPVPKAKPAQSTYKPYFVEFRARSAASYGHMYVLYGQVNGRGEIVKSDIAGLHPAGDSNNCENCSVVSWTLGHLLFVPSETGASDGDLEEKYVSARYRVMVDAATFKIVSAYISKLKAENTCERRAAHEGLGAGHDRHHGAAQGHHLPDRRQAAARGDRGGSTAWPGRMGCGCGSPTGASPSMRR